jgi:hypothetical protein
VVCLVRYTQFATFNSQPSNPPHSIPVQCRVHACCQAGNPCPHMSSAVTACSFPLNTHVFKYGRQCLGVSGPVSVAPPEYGMGPCGSAVYSAGPALPDGFGRVLSLLLRTRRSAANSARGDTVDRLQHLCLQPPSACAALVFTAAHDLSRRGLVLGLRPQG